MGDLKKIFFLHLSHFSLLYVSKSSQTIECKKNTGEKWEVECKSGRWLGKLPEMLDCPEPEGLFFMVFGCFVV